MAGCCVTPYLESVFDFDPVVTPCQRVATERIAACEAELDRQARAFERQLRELTVNYDTVLRRRHDDLVRLSALWMCVLHGPVIRRACGKCACPAHFLLPPRLPFAWNTRLPRPRWTDLPRTSLELRPVWYDCVLCLCCVCDLFVSHALCVVLRRA